MERKKLICTLLTYLEKVFHRMPLSKGLQEGSNKEHGRTPPHPSICKEKNINGSKNPGTSHSINSEIGNHLTGKVVESG